MITTVHLSRPVGPAATDAWALWLADHDLPEMTEIPVPNRLVYDDEQKALSVEVRVRDADGKTVWGPTAADRRMVTVMLAEHPRPFPPGYLVSNYSPKIGTGKRGPKVSDL